MKNEKTYLPIYKSEKLPELTNDEQTEYQKKKYKKKKERIKQ